MSTELKVFEGPFAVDCVVSDMLDEVREMQVDSADSFFNMTAIYAKAREWLKLIDTKKKEASAPARRAVAEINDRAKELTAPLEEVVKIANEKSLAYQAALEESNAKSAEAFGLKPMAVEPAKTSQAQIVTKEEHRYRIVDITKVPARYLLVNEDAVYSDLKLGIGQISGLEIYSETISTLRRR